MGLIEHPTNTVSHGVIGAAIEVHRVLGPGLLESSYCACLCYELELRRIGYQTEVDLPLEYKGIRVPIHSSQLMTYLRLRGLSSGLLINFNVHKLFDGLRRMLR